MLQDARDIRQKVENARKLQAMEQAKMKERQKKDVYSGKEGRPKRKTSRAVTTGLDSATR